MPASFATSIAKELAADTDATIGMPARRAFVMISKPARPDTTRYAGLSSCNSLSSVG